MTLDDFTELSLAQNDTALFFKNHPLPVIIDEVQRAPDLFLQIKLLADNSKEKGQIILNMASLSLREKFSIDFNREFLPTADYIESRKKSIIPYDNLWNHIWRGSMPELADNSMEWEPFYRSSELILTGM